MSFRMLEGDCVEQMRTLEAGSVQTCITSPPYYGLRDYGHDDQIGLEATPDAYVERLVGVFRGVRRVLREDGTLWLNLGDSYASEKSTGCKPKDLLGVPWLLAFALRADGWYLRSDIIWHKPNPMPESVTDRPTSAYEHIFLLAKSERYFYDADAIREPFGIGGGGSGAKSLPYSEGSGRRDTLSVDGKPGLGRAPLTSGRNKRNVWTVASQPFAGAHFAVFPPKLIEPCVLAGSPPKCCGECGAPWVRVTERKPMVVRPSKRRADWQAGDDHARTQTGGTMAEPPVSKTTGWRSTCSHNDDTGSATVLDPFAGSGTTGLVALRHNREFIGCELNPEYAQMARDRIREDAPLFNNEAVA